MDITYETPRCDNNLVDIEETLKNHSTPDLSTSFPTVCPTILKSVFQHPVLTYMLTGT